MPVSFLGRLCYRRDRRNSDDGWVVLILRKDGMIRMRAKGVWIYLCLVLCVGFFSTSLVKRRTENESGIELAALREGQDNAFLSEEDEVEESQEAELSNSALTRLRELDDRIVQNRAKESAVSVNSRKAVLENERRLWEGEVQNILNTLKEQLSADQQDELMLSQKEWMKERESQAIAASRKQSGTSMEELDYSMVLAEMTRERAYDLADGYGDYFK